MNKLKRYLLQKWDAIPLEKRNTGIQKVNSLLVYFLNALLLSIPLTIFLYFRGFAFFRTYIFSVASLWVIIPYVEHYYVWFRRTWYEEIQEDGGNDDNNDNGNHIE